MSQKSFNRKISTLAVAVLISGCSKQQMGTSLYERATDECLGDVVEKRFIVHTKNGEMHTVNADSEEEFIAGYLEENADHIEFAEPEYRVKNPAVQQQQLVYGSDNWGATRVQVDQLWASGYRGQNIVVAVVDSGMDLQHPQLQSRIFVNAGEQGTDSQGRDKATNGVDDDGNGYIDDFKGYDFVYNRPLQGDHQNHGTHVAGIIVAEHNRSKSGSDSVVQGLAPQARVLPLAFLGPGGSGYISDGVRAIKYAVKRGAHVINASWGGSLCSRSLKDAIIALEEKNVIFVAASGNESLNVDRSKMYPASLNLPAQITVGATGYYDFMAEFSNFGEKSVHIFAPGADIISTVPGGYAAMSGTSMAAPFVSGAIALLLGAQPGATISQVRAALYASAFKQSHYRNSSQGRMNLSYTLMELQKLH